MNVGIKLIKEKLYSTKGESLTETLVAILIAALSSALLVGMITTAAKLNAIANEEATSFYSELAIAEKGESTETVTESTVKIIVKNDISKTDTLSIKIYGESKQLQSYRSTDGGE